MEFCKRLITFNDCPGTLTLSLRIPILCFSVEDKNQYLEINVRDSGTGFKKAHSKGSDDKLYERGMKIINDLCERITYLDDGKSLNVLYKS